MFTGQLGTPGSQLGWIVLGGAPADQGPPPDPVIRWPYHTDARWEVDELP